MNQLDEHASRLCHDLSNNQWGHISDTLRDYWRRKAQDEADFPGYDFKGNRIELTGHDDF